MTKIKCKDGTVSLTVPNIPGIPCKEIYKAILTVLKLGDDLPDDEYDHYLSLVISGLNRFKKTWEEKNDKKSSD